MRVSPAELRAVRQGGILARYAVLGPVAFVQAELGAEGSRQTAFEEPCEMEHWGFVLRGRLRFEDGQRSRVFLPGTAFHIPAGPPAHRFIARGPCSIAGFAPLLEPVDDSPAALDARGVKAVPDAPLLDPPPPTIRIAARVGAQRSHEGVESVSAPMGSWTFMRMTFGPLSGFLAPWCDLPHWGIVLAGEVVHSREDGLELLGPGDAYWCPEGPPGHRFEVADSATVADYTPTSALLGPGRRPAYRQAALGAAVQQVASPDVV